MGSPRFRCVEYFDYQRRLSWEIIDNAKIFFMISQKKMVPQGWNKLNISATSDISVLENDRKLVRQGLDLFNIAIICGLSRETFQYILKDFPDKKMVHQELKKSARQWLNVCANLYSRKNIVTK